MFNKQMKDKYNYINKMFEDAINQDLLEKLNPEDLEKIDKILKDY